MPLMSKCFAERVAAEVRSHLARQRKTQSQLAAALGISQSALSRRLCGQQSFGVDELACIAGFLDVPITDLVAEAAA